MNENSIKFSIAEFMTLICGIVIVIAFFFLPWVGGGIDATQVIYTASSGNELIRDTEAGAALSGYTMLINNGAEAEGGLLDWTTAIFPIAALAGIVAGAFGLINVSTRQAISIVVAIIGAIGVLFFVAFFWQNNKAVVDGNLILGFGFWTTFFASVLLGYQFLVPRPPEEISAVDLTIDLLRVLIIVIVIAGASNTILSGKFTLANYISLFHCRAGTG